VQKLGKFSVICYRLNFSVSKSCGCNFNVTNISVVIKILTQMQSTKSIPPKE